MWKQLQIVGKEHFNMALKSTNDLFLYAWDTEVLETEWKELEKSVAYFCIISHWFFFGGYPLIQILFQALEGVI